MRLRSPLVHFFTLAIAVGAAASSSLGFSRPPSRAPAQSTVPAVRPPAVPTPRPQLTFITIDRVRYQVTCKAERFTSNIADIDPTPVVTLTLRRVDGRVITQLPTPQLTVSYQGVATSITLARTENVAPSPEVVYRGQGDALWPSDARLDARVTVPLRRGVQTVNLRPIPLTIVNLN